MTTICTAGHRPNRLGGYDITVARNLMRVARLAIDDLKPSRVVCGMAIGWDMALGLAAVERGIPLVCAVPFEGYSHHRDSANRTLNTLLSHAVQVQYVNQDAVDFTYAMHKRNEWMVNHSDTVAALWNGDKHSGTWHCIHYAMKQGKPTTNFWAAWQADSK